MVLLIIAFNYRRSFGFLLGIVGQMGTGKHFRTYKTDALRSAEVTHWIFGGSECSLNVIHKELPQLNLNPNEFQSLDSKAFPEINSI